MTVRRGGLGRGLGALIPTADPDQPAEVGSSLSARLEEVAVDRVRPNPRQPRSHFDEEAQAELVASIREVGLLQPVVVREAGDGFELVMGERRWRAAREAGLAVLPAIVRQTDDDVMLRDALLENLHRQQLNPLEEAAAYQQLLQEFGATHEELAQRVGRSRSQVTNTLRLLNLSPQVQRRVAAGVLSGGHARALLGVADGGDQDRLAARVVAEGLSVRAVEEVVALQAASPAPTPRGPTPERVRVPALAELSARLSEHFETRVKVEMGRTKGKVVLEFGNVEDLERIVGLMAPGQHAVAAPPASDAGAGADVANPTAANPTATDPA